MKTADKIDRKYSFCKSMVYAIQQITGEQTHDILSTLVSKGDELWVMHEIDPAETVSLGWYNEVKKRDYIYYPGTKLYLGVYVQKHTSKGGYGNSSDRINHLSYSFKLPQTYVKMNDKEYDDIAVDGMLMDSSFNFDEPTLKRPATPAEKKAKREEKQALAKAKRELKENAKKIP